MPVLRNPRHERFAQELAKGKKAEEAYRTAGFKPDRRNALKLHSSPEIIRRVGEILDKRETVDAKATEIAIQKLAITKERVLEELAKIGFANMLDYVTIGPDGDPFVDLSRLSHEQAAAVAEITVEDFKGGRGEGARDVRRVKFKLHDKKSALVDIGKHLGMFIERSEVGKPGDFSRLSEDELDDAIKDAAREVGITSFGEEVTARAGEAGGRRRTH